jgi:hypothetical protein
MSKTNKKIKSKIDFDAPLSPEADKFLPEATAEFKGVYRGKAGPMFVA